MERAALSLFHLCLTLWICLWLRNDAEHIRIQEVIVKLSLGVEPPAHAINSGSFSYRESKCAGAIVKSFPQWGRAWNGASSFSITGSNLLTAGQSGFSVK